MNREFLEKLGLPKEQVDSIMAEHGKAIQSNQTKLTTAEERVKSLETDLSAANKLVGDLKKETKETKELQDKIAAYEKQVSDLENERAKERKANAIKEALTKAGAKDIEYMAFKLGDVEVDKDGNIKDLENKIKTLKDAHKDYFTPAAADPKDDPKDPSNKGFKVIDTKLPDGSTKVFDLSKMSQQEINENWDLITKQAKNKQ